MLDQRRGSDSAFLRRVCLGPRKRRTQSTRTDRGNIEDERIHVSVRVLYMTITQNRDITARSPARVQYSRSVRSPGVKYVSGVLFLTRLVPPKGSETGAAAEQKKERMKTKEGALEYVEGWSGSSFFGCSRYVVIAAPPLFRSLLPVPCFPGELTIIIVVDRDAREMRLLSHYRFDRGHHRGCFTGHATSLLLRAALPSDFPLPG